MWIFVPRTTSASPLESGDSTSASIWRSAMLASSALSRSKPTPAKSWLRGWKKGTWIRRLFGRIYEPSTAVRGVTSWTESLQASRASLGPSQASSAVRTTLVISGLLQHASFEKSARAGSSSRTSPAICLVEHTRSPEIYKGWATTLRRACSLRRKSAQRTSGSGSSSLLWPTARCADSVMVGISQEQATHWKGTRGKIEFAAVAWATPRASPNENRGTRSYGRTGGTNLSEQAASWATPTARDGKDGACTDANVPTNGLLGRQAVRWPTPTTTDAKASGAAGYPTENRHAGVTLTDMAVRGFVSSRSRLDPMMPKVGESTSTLSEKTSLPRYLNPRFVQALMGWPVGWAEIDSTSCAPVEMGSSLSRPPSPSSPSITTSSPIEAPELEVEPPELEV